MSGSPRMVSVAIGAVLLAVSLGGCGGGSDSAVGSEGRSPAPAALPGGDPVSATGDDSASAQAEPEAGNNRSHADLEAQAKQGGGAGGDGRGAGSPDGEEQRPPTAPRTLRQLDAEVRRQLERGEPRSLEELTEQILREARVDSCPRYLQGSAACLDRP